MGEDLLQYIDQQLRSGYQPAAIRSYLVNAGYSSQDVEQAFSVLQNRYAHPYYSSQGQDPAAVYREQMRKMGYTEKQIEDYLESQGLVHVPEQKKRFDLSEDLAKLDRLLERFNISRSTFFLVCGGIFCIVAMLTVIILISGGGKNPPAPVYTGPDDVTVPDETEDVDEPLFPDIEEEEVPDTTEPEPFEDDNNTPPDDIFVDADDAQDTPSGPSSVVDSGTSLAGSASAFEVRMQDIISLAATNVDAAKVACEEFEEQVYGDICFSQIASKTDNQAFCSYIENSQKHDECLIRQAMKFNDFSGCATYKTERLKKTCEELSGG
jgi:hypothetical protein